MKTRLGSTNQGKIYLFISFALLAGTIYAVAAHARHQGPTPIYTTGGGIPDANQVGNINQAVQQTQQLLTALQAVNYDPGALPDPNLLFLADAQFAENPTFRQPNIASYTVPDGSIPEQSPIACFTDIYARKNTSYYAGDTSSSGPTGYYIIGWKTGAVQQVAVSDVRMMTSTNGSIVECFPGMTGYDPALPVWGK